MSITPTTPTQKNIPLPLLSQEQSRETAEVTESRSPSTEISPLLLEQEMFSRTAQQSKTERMKEQVGEWYDKVTEGVRIYSSEYSSLPCTFNFFNYLLVRISKLLKLVKPDFDEYEWVGRVNEERAIIKGKDAFSELSTKISLFLFALFRSENITAELCQEKWKGVAKLWNSIFIELKKTDTIRELNNYIEIINKIVADFDAYTSVLKDTSSALKSDLIEMEAYFTEEMVEIIKTVSEWPLLFFPVYESPSSFKDFFKILEDFKKSAPSSSKWDEEVILYITAFYEFAFTKTQAYCKVTSGFSVHPALLGLLPHIKQFQNHNIPLWETLPDLILKMEVYKKAVKDNKKNYTNLIKESRDLSSQLDRLWGNEFMRESPSRILRVAPLKRLREEIAANFDTYIGFLAATVFYVREVLYLPLGDLQEVHRRGQEFAKKIRTKFWPEVNSSAFTLFDKLQLYIDHSLEDQLPKEAKKIAREQFCEPLRLELLSYRVTVGNPAGSFQQNVMKAFKTEISSKQINTQKIEARFGTNKAKKKKLTPLLHIIDEFNAYLQESPNPWLSLLLLSEPLGKTTTVKDRAYIKRHLLHYRRLLEAIDFKESNSLLLKFRALLDQHSPDLFTEFKHLLREQERAVRVFLHNIPENFKEEECNTMISLVCTHYDQFAQVFDEKRIAAFAQALIKCTRNTSKKTENISNAGLFILYGPGRLPNTNSLYYLPLAQLSPTLSTNSIAKKAPASLQTVESRPVELNEKEIVSPKESEILSYTQFIERSLLQLPKLSSASISDPLQALLTDGQIRSSGAHISYYLKIVLELFSIEKTTTPLSLAFLHSFVSPLLLEQTFKWGLVHCSSENTPLPLFQTTSRGNTLRATHHLQDFLPFFHLPSALASSISESSEAFLQARSPYKHSGVISNDLQEVYEKKKSDLSSFQLRTVFFLEATCEVMRQMSSITAEFTPPLCPSLSTHFPLEIAAELKLLQAYSKEEGFYISMLNELLSPRVSEAMPLNSYAWLLSIVPSLLLEERALLLIQPGSLDEKQIVEAHDLSCLIPLLRSRNIALTPSMEEILTSHQSVIKNELRYPSSRGKRAKRLRTLATLSEWRQALTSGWVTRALLMDIRAVFKKDPYTCLPEIEKAIAQFIGTIKIEADTHVELIKLLVP